LMAGHKLIGITQEPPALRQRGVWRRGVHRPGVQYEVMALGHEIRRGPVVDVPTVRECAREVRPRRLVEYGVLVAVGVVHEVPVDVVRELALDLPALTHEHA
jgi:hypothetical protein